MAFRGFLCLSGAHPATHRLARHSWKDTNRFEELQTKALPPSMFQEERKQEERQKKDKALHKPGNKWRAIVHMYSEILYPVPCNGSFLFTILNGEVQMAKTARCCNVIKR